MDEKKLGSMKDDELNEVAGGATNYDFYGNPINNGPTTPVVVATPVNPGLNCSFVNENGATYICPSCGYAKFKIVSADSNNINLRCKRCGTNFAVSNTNY